jgi:hypothetical protein
MPSGNYAIDVYEFEELCNGGMLSRGHTLGIRCVECADRILAGASGHAVLFISNFSRFDKYSIPRKPKLRQQEGFILKLDSLTQKLEAFKAAVIVKVELS